MNLTHDFSETFDWFMLLSNFKLRKLFVTRTNAPGSCVEEHVGSA